MSLPPLLRKVLLVDLIKGLKGYVSLSAAK